jgi:hypothetical protein
MQTLDAFLLEGGAALPWTSCGGSIRLTSSSPRQTGAAWYRRKQNVEEGFDTYFTFEISNPSQVCTSMDDVHSFCRSRGADGLAFIIQNDDPLALGNSGSGLGYDGIQNGIAIEIDTFYNYDRLDHYENHISVVTRVRLLCMREFSFNTQSFYVGMASSTIRQPHVCYRHHLEDT